MVADPLLVGNPVFLQKCMTGSTVSANGGVRHTNPTKAQQHHYALVGYPVFLQPRSSLVCRQVLALLPLPLTLSTLPPPLNVQPQPIKAPLPLVRWRLSSSLALICWLVVASPVVVCLCLTSPFTSLCTISSS